MAKALSELASEATQIYSASQQGENTQVRVGGLFQDIVEWLEDNVTNAALHTPLAQIDSAELGNPANGQGLVYKNNQWQYGIFGGEGGGGSDTVDWDDIQNKPNTFTPSVSYGLRQWAEGDNTYLQLTSTEDGTTLVVSSLPWPSGGGGGSLPDNVVLYTEGSWAEHYSNQKIITTQVLNFGNPGGSGEHSLWINPTTGNLMFDDESIIGAGINWGNNTAPTNTLPNVVLNGNLYLQEDSTSQYGGLFAANKIRIADYRLLSENTYGYYGNRDIQVKEGELWYNQLQVTKTVDDIQMLNVTGGADDLHLDGNHLYLWNTTEEATIGSGVELPTSGGGGGSTFDYTTLGLEFDDDDNILWLTHNGDTFGEGVSIPTGGDAYCVKYDENDYHIDFKSANGQRVVGYIKGEYSTSTYETPITIHPSNEYSPVIIDNTRGVRVNGYDITTGYNGDDEDPEYYLYVNNYLIGSSGGGGGGGSTKLKVGSTTVSPDSNGIITIGYGGGTTVSTGTNSITISSTGGGGSGGDNLVLNDNILYLRRGTTNLSNVQFSDFGRSLSISGTTLSLKNGSDTLSSVTLPSGPSGSGVAAISVGGTQVASSGDTFSITNGTGISLLASQSGHSALISADFSSIWQPGAEDGSVVKADLNANVGTEYLNTQGINSLINLLKKIAPSMEISSGSNGENMIQFFGIVTLTNGSTLATNSYFYYDGTSEGVSKPVIFYNGSVIKVCLYKENSNYYYCGWNGSKPVKGPAVDPTTSTAQDKFYSILEAVRSGLSANAGITVTSGTGSNSYTSKNIDNMPNVSAKIAPRA